MKTLFNYSIVCLFSVISYAQQTDSNVYLKILGTLQDGGSPHLGCEKKCCNNLQTEEMNVRKVTSLAIHLPKAQKVFLVEATPDITDQWKLLEKAPDGIFLTHAHVGHYSGLLHLGREVLNAQKIPVYVMPRFYNFLMTNGPWSQLVELENIVLSPLQNAAEVHFAENLIITPLQVPHRDEFSETVGFHIKGPQKSALFIPDIDKWSIWEKDIVSLVSSVDYAFIDATFYSGDELPHRSIEEVPHPLVIETLSLFKNQSLSTKNKIYFIHMNHTNPLLDKGSKATETVLKKGFNIAQPGQLFQL